MSIWDDENPYNALPWLQEKALTSLAEAVRLVDLANEPDTTDWYARALKRSAGALIGRLAPLTAFLHGKGLEAAKGEQWEPMIEQGSLALARWCKEWKIADPREVGFAAILQPKEEQEVEQKAASIEHEPVPIEEEGALDQRNVLYATLCRKMVHGDLPPPAQRLLCWLLYNLGHSPHVDIVGTSKRFLPNDIHNTAEETSEAYKLLYDLGIVERVEGLPGQNPESLVVRLVAEGLNDTKHKLPYQPETFGFPGARVGGKMSMGQTIYFEFEGAEAKALRRWPLSKETLDQFADAIVTSLGEDKVFVESVELKLRDEERIGLFVKVRYPGDADFSLYDSAIQVLLRAFVRQKFLPSTGA